MTPEELMAIKDKLESLYPNYSEGLSQEYIKTIINIAYTIAKNDSLSGENLILGTALLTLDLLFSKVGSGENRYASKTIEGVSITYATGEYDISKWRNLYEMLLNGAYNSEYDLHYVGISG